MSHRLRFHGILVGKRPVSRVPAGDGPPFICKFVDATGLVCGKEFAAKKPLYDHRYYAHRDERVDEHPAVGVGGVGSVAEFDQAVGGGVETHGNSQFPCDYVDAMGACGKAYESKRKLADHRFNVHSGKRKPRLRRERLAKARVRSECTLHAPSASYHSSSDTEDDDI